MTPESQRIAIAGACKLGQFSIPHMIPDYLNDLNAMHEAEKVLTISQREDYVTMLGENYSTDSPNTVWWANTHATAAQRAEAFLRTLGLWKD